MSTMMTEEEVKWEFEQMLEMEEVVEEEDGGGGESEPEPDEPSGSSPPSSPPIIPVIDLSDESESEYIDLDDDDDDLDESQIFERMYQEQENDIAEITAELEGDKVADSNFHWAMKLTLESMEHLRDGFNGPGAEGQSSNDIDIDNDCDLKLPTPKERLEYPNPAALERLSEMKTTLTEMGRPRQLYDDETREAMAEMKQSLVASQKLLQAKLDELKASRSGVGAKLLRKLRKAGAGRPPPSLTGRVRSPPPPDRSRVRSLSPPPLDICLPEVPPSGPILKRPLSPSSTPMFMKRVRFSLPHDFKDREAQPLRPSTPSPNESVSKASPKQSTNESPVASATPLYKHVQVAPPPPPMGEGKGDQEDLSKRLWCECGKSYTKKSALVRHLLSKSNGDIFQCPHCPTKFALHSSLKHHTEKRHNLRYGQSFGCRDCGQIFSTFGELRDHRVTVHNYHGNRKSS